MTDQPRVALVTGATQGLGLALVQGLAERLGADDVVYATGRDEKRLAQIAETLGRSGAGAGAQIRTEHFDVADEHRAEELAESLARRHGGVDIVFNNAVMRVGPDDDRVPSSIATRRSTTSAPPGCCGPSLRGFAMAVG